MKALIALALLALSADAQTFTCVGCSDYGPIGTTGYTMQYGAKMVWTANVEPGAAYLVAMLFVEPVYSTKNQRPINALVNDARILNGFDILSDVPQFAPVTWHTPTTGSKDGKIIVVLTANNTGTAAKPVAHSAIISAISVVKLSGDTATSPPPLPTQSSACQMTLTTPKTVTMSDCTVQISGVFYRVPVGTISVTTGSGQARLVIDKSVSPPTGKVIPYGTIQLSCMGMSGCLIADPGAEYISDSLPVGLWTITNGQFDANGYTSLIAAISGTHIQSLSGLIQEQSGHTVKIRVNPDVIQIQ